MPWHKHTILTLVLVYVYRNPSTLLPLGPSPVVRTLGICLITSIPLLSELPSETLAFLGGLLGIGGVAAVAAGSAFFGTAGTLKQPEALSVG